MPLSVFVLWVTLHWAEVCCFQVCPVRWSITDSVASALLSVTEIFALPIVSSSAPGSLPKGFCGAAWHKLHNDSKMNNPAVCSVRTN